MTDNTKLIAELKRRADFPEDVPDRAFLVGIRHLLSQAAVALEATESFYAELGASMLPAHIRQQLEEQNAGLAAVIEQANLVLHDTSLPIHTRNDEAATILAAAAMREGRDA